MAGMRGLAAPAATLLAVCSTLTSGARALDNGLARTPPLGLSTWAVFNSHCNDSLVRQMADAMVTNGLRDAGYNYVRFSVFSGRIYSHILLTFCPRFSHILTRRGLTFLSS